MNDQNEPYLHTELLPSYTYKTDNMPKKYAFDEDRWGTNFNLKEDAQDEKTINGYIMWCVENYYTERYTGAKMWEEFHFDFEGWTAKIFNEGAKRLVEDLRE